MSMSCPSTYKSKKPPPDGEVQDKASARRAPKLAKKRKTKSKPTSPKLTNEDAVRLFKHVLTKEPDEEGLPDHLKDFKVVLPDMKGRNEKLGPPQFQYPGKTFINCYGEKSCMLTQCPISLVHARSIQQWESLSSWHRPSIMKILT